MGAQVIIEVNLMLDFAENSRQTIDKFCIAVVQEIFVLKIFVCEMFVLKIFSNLR